MVSLTTMYPAQANSPTALLASGITDSATSITVDNGNILPAATNWLTIGADTDEAETVLMTGKSGNVLTVTRGQQGTVAKAWAAGAKVQRCFTASDHDVLISNIGTLNSGKAETSHAASHASGGGDALTPADIGAATAFEFSGTLLTANWSGSAAPFTQTVTINDMIATMKPVIDVVLSSTWATAEQENEAWGGIVDADTGTDSLVFRFKEKPEISLNFQGVAVSG